MTDGMPATADFQEETVCRVRTRKELAEAYGRVRTLLDNTMPPIRGRTDIVCHFGLSCAIAALSWAGGIPADVLEEKDAANDFQRCFFELQRALYKSKIGRGGLESQPSGIAK